MVNPAVVSEYPLADRRLCNEGMRMSDPIPTFSYIVSRLAKDRPNLGYLHVINGGFSGDVDDEVTSGEVGLPSLYRHDR